MDLAEFPEGNDYTSNGMALCPLHHKAYDRGLVVVDEDYHVVKNERRLDRLKQKNLVGGLDRFIEGLRAEIILPSIAADRPRPEYLRRGLELRLKEEVKWLNPLGG